MMMRGLEILLLLLGTSAVTRAVKDSAWHNGIETPNVGLPMYWGDMPNILEDFGNFTKLYVQYHSCAWTQLGGFGDQEDTGRDMEENDYWYMGAMNSGVGWSYAPQIAFSLYGTLKGSRRSGCNRGTYINSFYTTSGFLAFSNAIANAGIKNKGNDFSLYCQNGIGLTCGSSGHGFAFTEYSDSSCTSGNEQSEGVSDALAAFNDVLSEAKCVELYDSSSGYIPYLLYHARSCQLNDEVGACPDPFGRKTLYDRRLSRALAGLAPDDEKFHLKMVKGYTLVGLGALFVSMAALLAINEKFYGPRRILKTKSLEDKVIDVEAAGEQKSRPILNKQGSIGLSDDIPPVNESVTDENSPTTDADTNSLAATPSLSFEPAIFKCGGQTALDDGSACAAKPALESVLDQVEDVVDRTNIECASEERIMACVQGAMDANATDFDCTAMNNDDVSISAEPAVAGEKLTHTLSIMRNARSRSLISHASIGAAMSTEAETTKHEQDQQERIAKDETELIRSSWEVKDDTSTVPTEVQQNTIDEVAKTKESVTPGVKPEQPEEHDLSSSDDVAAVDRSTISSGTKNKMKFWKK